MLLRDLEPGTDYEVTMSTLLGRSMGPATSLTARTGERAGCFLQAGWAGWQGIEATDLPCALGRHFC